MTTRVTLDLSDAMYERAQAFAKAKRQDVAKALTSWIDQTLPPVEVGSALDEEGKRKSAEDVTIDREMEAYIALHPTLKKRFWGKHVAIYGGELIDVDDDFMALYRRVREAYPNEFVWMSKVEEEPMPTLSFRSPRLAQNA